MRKTLFTFLLVLLPLLQVKPSYIFISEGTNDRPSVSFTFDDGSTSDMPQHPFKTWNQMILDALGEHDLKAVFFVTGSNKSTKKGTYLLESWDQAGHKIGNHTYSHVNFNDDKVSLEEFKDELLKTDDIINEYENYVKLFRFPYLKEGNTSEKINGFRIFMKENDYKNGHVSIDASDWYVNSRLRTQLRKDPNSNLTPYRKFYVEHLLERADYYENLSHELTGRHISHTLLLHHNLAAALFLDDLIRAFKEKGWAVTNADEAFRDKIYNEIPATVPAGESIIWALAKESGRYELRYPAESSKYMKKEMDELGL
jgi:peptidoglycan/xylan/chitin deacetylase (PgdA/CDA1 family)